MRMRRLVLVVLAVAILSGDLFAALRVVALTGQPAPGTGGFTIASLGIPLLNEAGNTAFQGTDNAISTINNFIWSGGGGGGTAIAAHEGSPAAGTPFGVAFGDVSFFSFNPNLSENGSVALTAPLTGTGVTTSNDSGIWRGTNSATLQLLGRKGSPAPGMPSGVNFNSFGTPKINSGGSVAFTGTLIGSGITTAND